MRDYHETDPEFAERFDHFAFDEVVNEEGQTLEPVTRHLAIVATLMGCQGIDEFRTEVPRALDAGLTPVMLKETIYQAVDYLGIGRVRPFLDAANGILESRGVRLPLEGQATTTMDDRLEKGVAAQVEIFGPQMAEAWKTGHINRWLAANCFGDYYTRTGLDLAQRELITFCFLAAQGGMRAPAHRTFNGEHEHGQRRRVPQKSRLPVPAVHRIPPEPECDDLHRQCRGADEEPVNQNRPDGVDMGIPSIRAFYGL